MHAEERATNQWVIDTVDELEGSSTVREVGDEPEAEAEAQLLVRHPDLVSDGRGVNRLLELPEQFVGLRPFKRSGAHQHTPPRLTLLRMSARRLTGASVVVEGILFV
jgi:hypothetical protein